MAHFIDTFSWFFFYLPERKTGGPVSISQWITQEVPRGDLQASNAGSDHQQPIVRVRGGRLRAITPSRKHGRRYFYPEDKEFIIKTFKNEIRSGVNSISGSAIRRKLGEEYMKELAIGRTPISEFKLTTKISHTINARIRRCKKKINFTKWNGAGFWNVAHRFAIRNLHISLGYPKINIIVLCGTNTKSEKMNVITASRIQIRYANTGLW